ncbi:hemerythrin domain-containing protein [Allorhizocola rhizosphaerae]|uniref:hemerythrin domain-containing protein n=1 Tax=Allorhizocola rhizosphaerae TaxID=1872709 RepID=UPI000E3D73AE|nr:hemerythrin domain-containing protein [Allorhizocola rhizosphaerae]
MFSPYLPPLPPLPGEREKYEYRPGGRSIISVLTDEHLQLEALSSELLKAEQSRRELADVVTAAVSRHLSAEEQYLYPAVRALVPDGDNLVDDEIDHDTTLLRQLAVLEEAAPDSPSYHDLAEAVDAEILRHGSTCASRIFPQLSRVASEADLIRLGNRLEIAEEAAPTRPHPDMPNRPPWNKIAAPAVGAVDKIRDSVEGRKTYREDL